jgi:hypothetical protein
MNKEPQYWLQLLRVCFQSETKPGPIRHATGITMVQYPWTYGRQEHGSVCYALCWLIRMPDISAATKNTTVANIPHYNGRKITVSFVDLYK